jgi:tyrosine-protein phosphatase OCA1
MNEKVVKFLEQNSIKLICIDSSINSTMGMRCGPSPVAEEIVFDALRVIIVSDNLPTLITCSTGKNITGVVAGCLRKLQRWSLISIFEEYRRYAGYSGSRIQQQHEQFIELFDTDLIKLSGQSPKFLGNTVDHSDHEELTNETTK